LESESIFSYTSSFFIQGTNSSFDIFPFSHQPYQINQKLAILFFLFSIFSLFTFKWILWWLFKCIAISPNFPYRLKIKIQTNWSQPCFTFTHKDNTTLFFIIHHSWVCDHYLLFIIIVFFYHYKIILYGYSYKLFNIS
jgi:hypothetical protein